MIDSWAFSPQELSPGNARPPDGRLIGLDGLRGIAALAVLTFHFTFRSAQLFPRVGTPWGAGQWGYYGVALFFVISGFVIFLSLQGSTIRNFVIARVIRLYPIYLVAAVITFFLVTLTRLHGRQVSPTQALANLPLVQFLWGAPLIDGVYWTLGVEVVFYVAIGVLHFTGLLRGRRRSVSLLGWLVVVCALCAGYRELPPAVAATLAGVHTALEWMPVFALGMVFYLLWSGERGVLTLILGPLSILASTYTLRDDRLTISIVAICALVTIALWGPSAILSNRPLRFLGDISYPLYLIHQNIGYIILVGLASVDFSRWVSIPVTVVVALALATALTFLADRPLRRLLRRVLLHRNTVG
jgi:peptidoglycan/LPS O-acetylase OafA/YrhL